MSGMEFSHPERIILVITALSEERKSILPFLRSDSITAKSDKHRREYITGDYFVGEDIRPWHILLPTPTSAGNAKSAAETALSLALNPAFVFLLGVAGGFPKKVNMYDVVVADRVYDIDAAKIDEEGSYIPRPDQHKATSVLLSRAKTLQDMGGWQTLLHPNLPNEDIEVWIEPIAAGSKLVASSESDEFKRIKRDAPRAVAVENEGFGVMQAAHEAAIAALVIRGISDLIDNRPTDEPAAEGGRVGPDRHKLKAARHAAAFMFALIGRLSLSEIEEVAKEEDEWVDVRLRWDDLKELAKGKRLALQILEGSPVRDLTAKAGSVEIEFKTMRLVSAFIYAVSLERNLLEKMIGLVPDRVDTKIDTSDPDVARIFSAVRKLGSTDEGDRRRGEEEVRTLTSIHESLKAFADKAVQASRRAATSANPLVNEELKSDMRVSLALSEGLGNHLSDLAQANDTTMTSIVATLLRAAAKEVKEKAADLSGYVPRYGGTKRKVTAVLPSAVVEEMMELGLRNGIDTRNELLRALIGYAVEMRLTDLLKAEPPLRRVQAVFDVDKLEARLREAALSTSQLARAAEISVSAVRRARAGQHIQRVTAHKILNALGSVLGRKLDDGEFLRQP